MTSSHDSPKVYYKYPACIPFLSMWYPPNIILSKLTRFLTLDGSFRLYAYFIIGHSLLASILGYRLFEHNGLFPALFGAVTLAYSGYVIKPQTPAFMYTMAWIPGIFIGGWFGALSLGMAILGGYWPILVYMVPVILVFAYRDPTILLGLIIGLFQIIPFLWYWPKSVRSGQKVDRKFGRLPWCGLKYLFIPNNSVGLINEVHYPESRMYVGIAVLFIFHSSFWYAPLLLAIAIACGLIPPFQRIPMRTLYLATLSISALAAQNCHGTFPLIIQSVLLLSNSSIYPSFPFSQWWDKPSKRIQDFTGYLTGLKLNDYKGAFALK